MSELDLAMTYRRVEIKGPFFVGESRLDGSVHCFEFPSAEAARKFDTRQPALTYARFKRPAGRLDAWGQGLTWLRWRSHGYRPVLIPRN
jgi:hypothetical protein